MELKKKNWNDITITDYKQIVEINKRELDSPLEKDIAVLSVLCDASEQDMYGLSIPELHALMEQMKWIKEPFTFNHNFKAHKIKINGTTYDVNPDIDKFTVAQYMDFQNFWDKRADNQYTGNLLAVFIIPQGHKYNDGYDVMELAKTLEDTLSIQLYNEVCFFFLKNYLNSIKASIVYSVWETRKAIRMEKDPKKKQMMKEQSKELEKGLRAILPIG